MTNKTRLPKTETVEQLPLSVSVSSWSGLLYGVKKSLREFKFSPFYLVSTHFLFWVNIGLLAMTWWRVTVQQPLLEKSVGVLFFSVKKSAIPAFSEAAVVPLQYTPYVVYALFGFLLFSTIMSFFVYSFGRYGITTFVFLLTLVVLLLVIRMILFPLTLLGGF
ncbi:MAG: hypothetical protein QY312_02275 [Candidatus Dojkabacteria bacterium]|nr:MAG: hypothetical protein QY312_02275 [Candidatus Dojkabacteria bacterium]